MPVQFRCTDSKGIEHDYELALHRPSEGAGIVRQLAALVIRPILTAAGPLVTGALTDPNVKSVADIDLAVLREIRMDTVADAAGDAILALSDGLLWQILRYTNRDGSALFDERNGRPSLAFEQAYAANYLEIGKAAWEVCQANGFFGGPDIFSSVQNAARGLLPAARAKSQPNAT